MVSGRRILAVAILAGALIPSARAGQPRLDVSVAQPVLRTGQRQTTFLKVGLTGFEMADPEERTPVNIALVLDRSGSMSGQKIEQAREAACMAVDRLGPQDILSVIAYDDVVQVLVPATKVSDRDAIKRRIRGLEPGGSTALFAGTSKGADEIRKFLDANRVNRVVLLSDGLANVGPSSPGELQELGLSLSREGISVSTIGLGLQYNEDLMARLARASDGNHAFVENATDLARIFNHEFGDVLSVVCQEVAIRVEVADGIRPVRVLGRDAIIDGQTVLCDINQIYSKQEKYLMLEIDVPPGTADASRPVAAVEVSYANMGTGTNETLSSSVAVRFSPSEEVVAQAEKPEVMVEAVKLVSAEQNRLAYALRDEGKIEEARQLLKSNADYLDSNWMEYNDDDLKSLSTSNRIQSEAVNLPEASEEYQRARKEAYDTNDKLEQQRTW